MVGLQLYYYVCCCHGNGSPTLIFYDSPTHIPMRPVFMAELLFLLESQGIILGRVPVGKEGRHYDYTGREGQAYLLLDHPPS